MASRVGEPKDDVLNFVIHPAACLERARLGVERQIMEVRLEKPEGLQGKIRLSVNRPRRTIIDSVMVIVRFVPATQQWEILRRGRGGTPREPLIHCRR